MKKILIAPFVGLVVLLLVATAPQGQPKGDTELAKAVSGATVSLAKGLAASAREGKPISAKFELEHGVLQLSVYTAKGGKFSEVIVDHTTGKEAKVDAITGGEDLTAAKAAATELKLPANLPVERFDFETKGIEGWQVVDGRWTVEEMASAPSGKRVLVQRATQNEFNVIVAAGGPYADADVSVRFKPISGREDASGGIVFRFSDGRYYVIRANALENNFRLYYYDRGRHQLASATVEPPAIGQWHTIRVVALGDRIQGHLNGALLLDHRDGRFRSGQVGLWTKADSVTAFDDLVIRGVPGRTELTGRSLA